jgi:hypothetical protein
MERELFRALKKLLVRLGRRRRSRRFRYSDAVIIEVYYWAVLNDRPVHWACRAANWPKGLRRGPLPSQPEMSRRLRTASVARLIGRLEELALRAGRPVPLVYVIDGKALAIAGHSRDKEAGYGRGTCGKAKGYKLHVLIGLAGTLWGWRIAPMNRDERTMARRLTASLPGQGYLLADANYNSNRVFAAAARRGVQLVSPRKARGPGPMGLGHRRHDPARLRSIDLLENGVSDFGQSLHQLRRGVERFFSTLSSTGGGLTCLPGWVRRYRRVRRWVQAKLIIHQLRTDHRLALRA